MNSHEAKRLLEMLRPGEVDSADPRFAEALQQAETDPELSRWFADQKQFDRAFASALKDVPIPADLRQTILANRPKVPAESQSQSESESQRRTERPERATPKRGTAPKRGILTPNFWLGRHWAIPATAAAALIIGAIAVLSRPAGFSEFRHELVKKADGIENHLEFKSTDLNRIQQWLASQGIAADVTLPAALQEMHVQGCQVVQAAGQRVPMLCLIGGSKHLHLFVVEGAQLAGLPQAGTPDFERCGSWKTAAWQHGDKTYLLSGLKSYTFVNKFRKAGRWILWG